MNYEEAIEQLKESGRYGWAYVEGEEQVFCATKTVVNGCPTELYPLPVFKEMFESGQCSDWF